MRQFVTSLIIASWLALALVSDVHAVRIMTNPSTATGTTPLQFDNFALTPDGNTIVATGTFNALLTGDRVYSLPVPANPAVDTSTITQLSTGNFSADQAYDVAFAPVISPDGQTVLFVHDRNTPGNTDTIYTMPISGELAAPSFTGLFGANPNLVSPGDGNSNPIYSITPTPGDFDVDNDIDGFDFLKWQRGFDAIHNASDLADWEANYGTGAVASTDVFFLNNNAGFGGSIPTFSGPGVPYDPNPDWDVIYKRDSGGTVTAVTAPGDGDIDARLFTVTPSGTSIVYAPDNPVKEGKDRGGIRPKLFTISTSGGASTEISFTAPAHDFTISRQLEVTSDGLTVLFIADYEAVGKKELFSVPITGGTPTRISDDIPWSGDVSSFAIAPNGLSVAYVAGQNNGANSELFQTPITGGTGNSIRVSDPAPSNSGTFDVSTSATGGQIVYSNDSAEIYYLGDLDTADVNDLYVVDTTAKAGLVPSPFTFIGPSGGDFFDENNWEDADSNNPAADTINPGSPIRHALIIDGDTVSTTGTGLEADFQVGGSLEMTSGSVLDFSGLGNELDFNPGSGFKLTDATITVHQDVFLEGTNVLSGGTIRSTADDIEFQDGHESSINGTTFISDIDNILFDNSLTSVTGASFVSNDRLGLRFEVDVTVTDTNINVRGMNPTNSDPGGDGHGDVEDIFTGPQGDGSTLTLDGASTLLANAIQDGVDLVLDGTSVATLLGDPGGQLNDPPGGWDLVDPTGMITFMSTGAEMITMHASATDVRALVINGITGMSYLADPLAWNFTTWDGLSALASLRLAAPLSAGSTAVPEPSGIALLLVGLAALSAGRRGSDLPVSGLVQ